MHSEIDASRFSGPEHNFAGAPLISPSRPTTTYYYRLPLPPPPTTRSPCLFRWYGARHRARTLSRGKSCACMYTSARDSRRYAETEFARRWAPLRFTFCRTAEKFLSRVLLQISNNIVRFHVSTSVTNFLAVCRPCCESWAWASCLTS